METPTPPHKRDNGMGKAEQPSVPTSTSGKIIKVKWHNQRMLN